MSQDPWKRCLDPAERYCPDPPPPASFGASSDWDEAAFAGGKTPFDTEVRYSCKEAMKLKPASGQGELYESQSFTCQWNQTWDG